ncbi:MAG: nuclear transport factor 2 family protein [Paludibacteraceae bacterium]|nr:nuclear transport factor 2 family protein [Paludibacteraceae bacterium]
MRKLFICLLLALPITMWADVTVTISDGIDNETLKSKMEAGMSALLTEINNAQAEGRALNFAPLGLDPSVQISLSMLWENSPFLCTDEKITERGLTTPSGYQVRNIPLLMKPKANRNFNETEYQEAVISFDKKGNIESFYLSLSMNLYMSVIKENKEITDLRRRQLILDYVERFRTAYNTKDIEFLEQVFSDDALIITGKVISQKKNDIKLPDKIVYTKQTKTEYLGRLRQVFKKNSYIKVTFDEIKVMRHPSKKFTDFYGVTLHQGYTSSSYHDDGYLFLLWDFRDEEHPIIHVRTWQPDAINGERLPEDEVFSIYDFEI